MHRHDDVGIDARWRRVALEALHVAPPPAYAAIGNGALFRWSPTLIGAICWSELDLPMLDATDLAIAQMFAHADGPVRVFHGMSAMREAHFTAPYLRRARRTAERFSPHAASILRGMAFIVTVDWVQAFWQGINAAVGMASVDTFVTDRRAEATRWLGLADAVAEPIVGLSVALSTGGNHVFSAVEGFLERDPSADLERTAAALGRSVRSLQRELAARGATFLETRTRIRVRLAQDLLLWHPSIKVGVVGAEVGFGSASQFHDAFKRATGMSPSAFRHLGAEPDAIGARPERSGVAAPLGPPEDGGTGTAPAPSKERS